MPVLPQLAEIRTTTATEQVFQVFHSAIISLELPPGSKVSEVDAAKSLGVSRQPVRDAFFRLSELGFLRIQPQRATTITHISEQAVKDALFVRTALEVECLRAAFENVSNTDISSLQNLLDQQARAIEGNERLVFHKLDDQFHRTITEIAGHPGAWNLIRDQKVHLDRVRFLSLSFGAKSAFDDHRFILDCFRHQNSKAAESRLRDHLSRILEILRQVQVAHADYFTS